MRQAITTTHLSKQFGQTQAVTGIDIDVRRGEVFGVVGPDGAGKTTLLQLLAALLDPTAGSATVLGYDVVRDAEALRQRLGYVSQTFTLYGTLSVEENLDFFAELYGVPAALREQRKAELLAWSRLVPFRHRRAARLSGGMQKKLHLCCTLIHTPDVLFLDEPTTGVDPVSRRELWAILYDLVGRGLTLVVATPYMDEAERCHRVALLDSGKLLRCDSPDGLRRDVNEIAWELRSRDLRRVHNRLLRMTLPFQFHRIGDHLHMVASRDIAVADTVQQALQGDDPIDLHLRQLPLTMEDVFLTVTGKQGDRTERVRQQTAVREQPWTSRGDDIIVRLQDLSRTFGDFVAVDRLSLAVKRGEIFGFLGPNGSGKTTTIRMLCGLLPPSSGDGDVLGQDIRRQGRRIKSRIGYMSQHFSLYNDLTVGENLAFFGAGYGLSSGCLTARMAWVLAMAGLAGEERRLVRELSGGVKQRLALGCAILHEPDILFLDEPTAGVDPLSRRQFWALIDDLAATGMTVFVTTHYMDEAENCQRLGLIYQGRLVATGSPTALKEGLQAGVMLELTCSDPFAALRRLQAEPALTHVSLFGRHLHVLVEDPATARRLLHTTLQAIGQRIEHLEETSLSLEDLFVLLIEREERQQESAHA